MDGGRVRSNLFILLSDSHLKYYSKRSFSCFKKAAIKLVKDYGRSLKAVIITGDYLDFYHCSRFDKNPKRVIEAQKEFDLAKELLLDMQSWFPEWVRLIYIAGNHEHRVYKDKMRNTHLFGLDDYSVESLLGIEDTRWEYVPYGKKVKFRKFRAHHGSIVRKNSGYSAHAELAKSNMSGVTGHTHRGCVIFKTRDGVMYWHVENFCMCDSKAGAEYNENDDPDWQNGFTMVYEIPEDGWACPVPVPIEHGVCIVEGEVIEAD